MIFDTAIIGTGPAGLSAALNLKLHNKSILWFGPKSLSPKVDKSEMILNYPGIPRITGKELNEAFLDQVREMGLDISEKTVTNINPLKTGFMILADNEIFEARTVLLATGVFTGKPFTGEEQLLGKGVSYCATCDGFLYKGKTIAVYCGSERYEHEVRYLSELADRIYLARAYKGSPLDLPNVKPLDSGIVGICGENRVSAVRLADGSEIDVDGVFILRNSIAPDSLIKGIALDGAHIVSDRLMRTGIPGCFAAGDCTGRPYQIAKAAGEGNIAAHSILEYLSML